VFRHCKTNLRISNIEDVAILADEDVSEDPTDSSGLERLEAQHALSVTSGNDVVVVIDSIWHAVDCDGHWPGRSGASDHENSELLVECTAKGFSDGIDGILGSSNQRRTGVGDCVPRSLFYILAANTYSGYFVLPVSLTGKFDPSEVASVSVDSAVHCVISAIGDRTSNFASHILAVSSAHPNGENVHVKEFATDHILYGRNHVINRDCWPSETANAVQWLSSEEWSQGGCLSEGLLRDTNSAHANCIDSQESAGCSSTVLNRPRLSVCFIGFAHVAEEMILSKAGIGCAVVVGAVATLAASGVGAEGGAERGRGGASGRIAIGGCVAAS